MGGTPSIRQMASRANAAHVAALLGSAKQDCLGPFLLAFALCLTQRCTDTLRRWGCLTDAGELTPRGRDLLAALSAEG